MNLQVFVFVFLFLPHRHPSDTHRKQGSFFVSGKLPNYDPGRVSKATHYVVPLLLNLNVQMLATTSLVIVDLHSFWLNFKLRMTNSQTPPLPLLCYPLRRRRHRDGSNNNVKKTNVCKTTALHARTCITLFTFP